MGKWNQDSAVCSFGCGQKKKKNKKYVIVLKKYQPDVKEWYRGLRATKAYYKLNKHQSNWLKGNKLCQDEWKFVILHSLSACAFL